jgi:hypothetical protein
MNSGNLMRLWEYFSTFNTVMTNDSLQKVPHHENEIENEMYEEKVSSDRDCFLKTVGVKIKLSMY